MPFIYICSDGVLSGKDEQMKINKLTIMYWTLFYN